MHIVYHFDTYLPVRTSALLRRADSSDGMHPPRLCMCVHTTTSIPIRGRWVLNDRRIESDGAERKRRAETEVYNVRRLADTHRFDPRCVVRTLYVRLRSERRTRYPAAYLTDGLSCYRGCTACSIPRLRISRYLVCKFIAGAA